MVRKVPRSKRWLVPRIDEERERLAEERKLTFSEPVMAIYDSAPAHVRKQAHEKDDAPLRAWYEKMQHKRGN